MFDFKLFLDPVIITILILFVFVVLYYLAKVSYIKDSLNDLTNVLRNFKKGNIAYRFKELDEILSKSTFLSTNWTEFKNTLVFNGCDSAAETSVIQCSVDSSYYFNEETLVHSKLNYKFISAVPTILTGLGPLFTFLHISLAFAKVDFATQEATLSSVSSLLASMKIAAMISVVAVGTSILFILIERLLYKNLCLSPLTTFQAELSKLFDNISSEKFLIELLKESRLQNSSLSKTFESLPVYMKTAFDKSFKESLVPYLDNLIFSVNKLQENLNNKQSKGILEDLFGSNDEE